MRNKVLQFAIACITIFTLQSNMSMAQIQKVSLEPFPKPVVGEKMLVIEVPHSAKDAHKKIEFYVGKMMEVDACNRHGLMGTTSLKNLEGWGYSYYSFQTKGDAFSTQMGCPDNTKVWKFISAQPTLIDYNGRMPIVIYVPEDYEVRFKIYQAEDEEYSASEIRQK